MSYYEEVLVVFNRKNTIKRQVKTLKRKKQREDCPLIPYSILEANKSFRLVDGRRIRKGNVFLYVGGDGAFQSSPEDVCRVLDVQGGKKNIKVELLSDFQSYKEVIEHNFNVIKKI